MVKHKNLLPLAAFLAVAAVLAYILCAPIGVAEGGGLHKTLDRLGLEYINAPIAEHFDTVFKAFKSPRISNTPAAVASAALFGVGGVLDVRRIGGIYGILLAAGIALAVAGGARGDSLDGVFALLCVLMFADTAYTAYFNTLYPVGSALVFFIILCAFLMQCYKGRAAHIYLVLPAAFFALAFAFCGIAAALIAVVFGLLIARLASLGKSKLQKAVCIAAGAAVMAGSLSFALSYKSIDYEKDLYNAVFFGTSKHASVAELGLDSRLDALSSDFYTDEISEEYSLNQRFYSKISYKDIAAFYLKNPAALAAELSFAASNAYNMRPSYLGNFSRAAAEKKEGQSRFFCLYSSFKARLIPNTLGFTALFFALYFGFLIYIIFTDKKSRPIAEFAIGIGVGALIALIAPIIITGRFEAGVNLFIYNIMFDCAVLFSAVAGSRYMLARKKQLQAKYGANQ